MELAVRIYIVEEDSIRQLSSEKYISINERKEPLVEYSGKAIKYVMVSLVEQNGNPKWIEWMQGCILHLDEQGYLDEEWRNEEIRLVINQVSWDTSPPEPESTLIKAKDKFLKKRLRDQFTWQLDAETIRRITETIFGQ